MGKHQVFLGGVSILPALTRESQVWKKKDKYSHLKAITVPETLVDELF